TADLALLPPVGLRPQRRTGHGPGHPADPGAARVCPAGLLSGRRVRARRSETSPGSSPLMRGEASVIVAGARNEGEGLLAVLSFLRPAADCPAPGCSIILADIPRPPTRDDRVLPGVGGIRRGATGMGRTHETHPGLDRSRADRFRGGVRRDLASEGRG